MAGDVCWEQEVIIDHQDRLRLSSGSAHRLLPAPGENTSVHADTLRGRPAPHHSPEELAPSSWASRALTSDL